MVATAKGPPYPRRQLVRQFSCLLLPFSFFVLICDGKLAPRMTYFARFYHLPLASGSRPTPRPFDLRVRADGEGHDFADGGIRLRDVTVRYGRRIALEAVSGEFAPGSLTAVVGANGAGKSTLLAAIAGVKRLAGGGVDGPGRRRLAYLPQLSAIDRG